MKSYTFEELISNSMQSFVPEFKFTDEFYPRKDVDKQLLELSKARKYIETILSNRPDLFECSDDPLRDYEQLIKLIEILS